MPVESNKYCMKYEFFSFLVIVLMVFFLRITRRWVRWPFSLRALYWCGAFSYMMVISLPRIFVWQSIDTMIQIVFWGAISVLFAWILSYHDI